jgi:Ca-activated chloride channel family protein
LDVSVSMQAADTEPTRLGRAVQIARELVDVLNRDRIGLTLFAGKAYPLAPPTTDRPALRYLLAGVTPTLASAHDPGTLLSVGIDSAADLLGVLEPDTASGIEDEEERAIIVIGDGEAGELDQRVAESARAIAARGVTIHTIGVGTLDGAGMVVPSAPFQLAGRVLDGGGAPVISRLRESTLMARANAGGGHHVNATDESALRNFFSSLVSQASALTPVESEAPRERHELALWLIVGALFCLFLESLAEARIPWSSRPLTRRDS